MINKISPFRGWVQKVLPAVYDDSLSYYELLSKVIQHLNDIGTQVNSLIDVWQQIEKWLKEEVAPAEIEKWLDESFENGEFTELINETIFNELNKRIDSHGVYVTEFLNGVEPTPQFNWTDTIKRAFTYAKENGYSKVIFPKGTLYLDYMEVPNGVGFEGQGLGHFGYQNIGTVLRQNSNVNRSFITFKTQDNGDGIYRVGPMHIRNLILFGDSSNTVGNGLDFKDSVTGEPALIQATTIIENITVRGFPQSGISIPGSALPITFRNVNSMFNGSYGFYYNGLRYSQAVRFDNCDGDGNLNGLIMFENVNRNFDNIHITNLRSEKRVNPHYGDKIGQENVIILKNCNQANFIIDGVNHFSSIPGQNPGHIVVIRGEGGWHAPTIQFRGLCAIIRSDVPEGTTPPGVIRDEIRSLNIPLTTTSGIYGYRAEHIIDTNTQTKPSFIVGDMKYNGEDFLASNEIQSAGNTPAYTLFEKDAEINEKFWGIVASSGNLSIRTADDGGGTPTMAMEMTREGNRVSTTKFHSSVITDNFTCQQFNPSGTIRHTGQYVGFNGNDPLAKQPLLGTTTEEKLNSVIDILKKFGFIQ